MNSESEVSYPKSAYCSVARVKCSTPNTSAKIPYLLLFSFGSRHLVEIPDAGLISVIMQGI